MELGFLITVIIVIIIVGLILWLVNSFLPIDARFKQILNVIVVVLLIIWILVKLSGVTL